MILIFLLNWKECLSHGAVPSDIGSILKNSGIKRIYANGNMAKKLYEKYILPEIGVPIIGLPSTSPANAAYSLERLKESWKQIL